MRAKSNTVAFEKAPPKSELTWTLIVKSFELLRRTRLREKEILSNRTLKDNAIDLDLECRVLFSFL